MHQNEDFISPSNKNLINLINISRWVLLFLGFTFIWLLGYKQMVTISAIPAGEYIIPAVIIIYNGMLTWLSIEVKNKAMAWVLILMETVNAGVLMVLYGTQFALIALIIPIMETALFLESITFIIMILLGIGILLAGVKEILIELNGVLIKTHPSETMSPDELVNLIRFLMFRSVLASVTLTALIAWLFNESIKAGKNKEKERKRVFEQKFLFEQQIDELNDKLTQVYREKDSLSSQIVKLEHDAANIQDDLKSQNAVTQVINLITSAKSPDEALERAIRNIEKIVPCQTCCIYISQEVEGEEEFVPAKVSSPFKDMLLETSFLLEDGIIGWVGATGEPALIKNGSFTPPGERLILPTLLEPEPSALALPIGLHDIISGVLYISHPTPNAIAKESEALLNAITVVLAGIITPPTPAPAPVDSQAIQEAEARFRQKEQDMSNMLDTMNNIVKYNQKMFETLDIRGTINRVVATVKNVITCQTCVIFLEKKVEGETLLEATGVSSRYADFFKNYIIKPDEEIIGYVYRNNKDVIIRDGVFRAQDQRGPVEYNVLLKYERSALVMPLMGRDRPIGVIYISKPEADGYTAQDKEILSIVTQSAVLAINNSEQYEKSINLAITDEITGLENRVYFERRLEEELARSRRFDFGFAVALVDIDQFSRFNNLYGTEVGDHLLREVGLLLSSYCRDADCITRLENDLFGILLLHINKNDAVMTTERLRTFIEARAFGTELGEAIQLTVSMGVSVYPDDGEEKDALVDQAWVSLEEAQSSGGNKTYFMG